MEAPPTGARGGQAISLEFQQLSCYLKGQLGSGAHVMEGREIQVEETQTKRGTNNDVLTMTSESLSRQSLGRSS